MPTYVYECAKCGDEIEQWQSFSDEPLKKHPGCGGKLAKVFQPVGIVFKGSGFYKTDSRSAGNETPRAPTPPRSTRARRRSRSPTPSKAGVEVRRAKKSDNGSSSSTKKSESSTSGRQVVVVSAPALPALLFLPPSP